MNTRLILGSLTGAVLLHVAMTACSSTSSPTASAQDASASPAAQVVVEACDKTFPIAGPPLPLGPGEDGGPPAQMEYYAEAAFPGLTAAQLAGHVTNWNTVTSGSLNVPPTGYSLQLQTNIYVKDGFVGAGCEPGTQTTFIYAP